MHLPRIVFFLLCNLIWVAPATAAVDPPSLRIYYNSEDNPRDSYYRQIAQHAVAKWNKDGKLQLEEAQLDRETAPQVNASSHLVFVRPTNIGTVVLLAKAHPDVKFTLIDPPVLPSLSNIRSVMFKDHEGAFLIGMISALTSQTGLVGFIGERDTPFWRNIGYGYYQGVKFVNASAEVHSDMASASQSSAALFEAQIASNIDEVFVTGFEELEQIYDSAQRYHRHLMLLDVGSAAHSSPWKITTLTRRIDFALRDSLNDIAADKWQPGVVQLGIREGYIDYVLDEDNKTLLPHEVIDRVEIAKDLIIRDVIQVKPYTQH